MEENIICRTCLRATKNYVSIFSAPELWGKKIVLAKLIMACAPVVIKIDDGLPTKICDDCLQLLQLSFLFRLRVITANENYKEIIRTQATPNPQLQIEADKQVTNLNQIYSSEYIFESINESAQSTFEIVETIKREPLDIKEEIVDKHKADSLLIDSSVTNNNFTIEATTSLDTNKLNSVAPNQQKICNNRKKQTFYTKKNVTCREKNQPKTVSNINKVNKNSKTTNNKQAKKNPDISIDKIEYSFPTVENSQLVIDSPQNLIGNKNQIDNGLNFKLRNTKQRIKRTYSKVDNNTRSSSVSKITKLTDKIKISYPGDLVSDDKSDHNNRLNYSKNRKTIKPKLNTNDYECIIVDDN